MDDEPAILNLISAALRHKGHDIRAFSSPEQALAEAEQSPNIPQVMFVDWVLGSFAGLELIETLQERMEQTGFVLMSGDPAGKRELPDGVQWLSKPFRLEELYRFTG